MSIKSLGSFPAYYPMYDLNCKYCFGHRYLSRRLMQLIILMIFTILYSITLRIFASFCKAVYITKSLNHPVWGLLRRHQIWLNQLRLYEEVVCNQECFVVSVLLLNHVGNWQKRRWHLMWNNWNGLARVIEGIILCMLPANERRRYIPTSLVIGLAQTQNDPVMLLILGRICLKQHFYVCTYYSAANQQLNH